MIQEHERIVLTSDPGENGLAAGDVGTVVYIHRGGEAYEVEFISLQGETVAVLTLTAAQVRPVAQREIPHARLIA
jgi:hypothetical protein